MLKYSIHLYDVGKIFTLDSEVTRLRRYCFRFHRVRPVTVLNRKVGKTCDKGKSLDQTVETPVPQTKTLK